MNREILLHCRPKWPDFLDYVIMKLFLTVKDTVLIHNFQAKLFCCSDNILLLFSDGSVPHLCAIFLIYFEVYLEQRQQKIQRLVGSPFILRENGFVTACDLRVINGTQKLRE